MMIINRVLCVIILFVSVSISLIAQEEVYSTKISERLQNEMLEGSSDLEFIVLLKEQANLNGAKQLPTKVAKGNYVFARLQEQAARTQQPLIDIIQAYEGVFRSFFVVNAIKVKGSAELLTALARHRSVRQVIGNSPYQVEEPIIENNLGRTPTALEWGLEMINADDVWGMGYRGQGVVIGGQDTGYDWRHPALRSNYRGYVSADSVDHNYSRHDAAHAIHPNNEGENPCGLDIDEPCDDNSHGTHTMGTMVGLDGDNQIGVAPEAKWIGCRNMERGRGTPEGYIECFEWMMAPTDLNNENPNPALAPVAFANSWGCPLVEGCDSSNYHIMNEVVNNVKASGIVVVVSTGNGGSECSTITDPAAIFENSFSVGSTQSNDTISSFSSRGPVLVDGSNRRKPDISAPGSNIRSAVLNNEYATHSGTSMAGPHVVGVIALMISANPDLAGQVDSIENIIEQTAVTKTTEQDCGDILGTAIPNNTYGHGRIDALAAVERALAMTITSTEELDPLVDVKLYPNPFDKEIALNLGRLKGNTVLNILSLTGKKMKTWTWDLSGLETEKNLDLSNLDAGIYFYEIENGGNLYTGKIMKK